MHLLVWFAVLVSGVVHAHPYGSDFYGHKLLVMLDRDSVQVEYLAEVPTTHVLRQIRQFVDENPEVTPADNRDAFNLRVLQDLENAMLGRVGFGSAEDAAPDQALQWTRLTSPDASGVGDSRFMGYRISLQASLPQGARTLSLFNGNYPEQQAYHSVELRVSDAVQVDACSLFTVKDGHLARDRDGQWRMEEESRDLRISFQQQGAVGERITRTFRTIAGQGEEAFQPASTRLSTVHQDPLQDFVTGTLTPGVVLMGLLLAIVLGAAHAFSPGHGKALVAAYLLGSRQTIRHAVWLGIIVTVTHTLAVFVLGIVALLLAERAAPEVFLPWMEVGSGALVLGIGARLWWTRLRALQGHTEHGHEHHDHGHQHHDHGHEHHDHGHQHHDHEHAHEHHEQAHDHGHHHGHEHHDHGSEHAHAQAHAQAYVSAGEGWRGLVALGVSGGLVPCPTALVVLLTAISFHRVGFGLALVTAFSLGLGLVLVAVGSAVVILGERMTRGRPTGRVIAVLPVVSACIVTLVGAGITWRGVQSVLGG
ncbi:MAG: sulfite exporter TauE/SafE family protein [Myxococcota bacterium]|nr:sulfite exporter TauE/SafE family protein [Myxococcota bacterium]